MRKKTGISFIFDSRHSPMELLLKTFKIVFVKRTERYKKKKLIPSCPLGRQLSQFACPRSLRPSPSPTRTNKRNGVKLNEHLFFFAQVY